MVLCRICSISYSKSYISPMDWSAEEMGRQGMEMAGQLGFHDWRCKLGRLRTKSHGIFYKVRLISPNTMGLRRNGRHFAENGICFEWRLLHFYLNFTDIWHQGYNKKCASTGSGHGLLSYRRQAIIWVNDVLVQQRTYVSISRDELICWNYLEHWDCTWIPTPMHWSKLFGR